MLPRAPLPWIVEEEKQEILGRTNRLSSTRSRTAALNSPVETFRHMKRTGSLNFSLLRSRTIVYLQPVTNQNHLTSLIMTIHNSYSRPKVVGCSALQIITLPTLHYASGPPTSRGGRFIINLLLSHRTCAELISLSFLRFLSSK
jgi:hypothetical protein